MLFQLKKMKHTVGGRKTEISPETVASLIYYKEPVGGINLVRI